MRWAVYDDESGGGALAGLDPSGALGAATAVPSLATAVAAGEAADVRWVWPDTARCYPGLLRAGARVARCHDLALAEGLLLGHAGRWGEPRALPAAWARLHDLPVPDDEPSTGAPQPGRPTQPALFAPVREPLPGASSPLAAVAEVHADQQTRIAALPDPARFRLLVAVESAGALAAAELGAVGLPWRADVHDRLLTEALGARPVGGGRPPMLAGLAAQIDAAFGFRLNPDSPAEVVAAFRKVGVTVTSTRAYVLREVEHPAVAPLLRYKELSRLHVANGWQFLADWVVGGRFRPEYVAGAVVSGRWGTRGGGALQIPKAVRRAVVADPGWTLVVADAGQLEPRVLAALSGDRGMATAAGPGDMYGALAASAFDGDRGKAKIALLAAMYGGTTGAGGALLATLRRRFPDAVGYVEAAARVGEQGGLVRSLLGRTCPPASTPVAGPGEPAEAAEPVSASSARARGRFTRNFVIQATAAEWALLLLAELRRRLTSMAGTELVFFQHDEVVVHCRREVAAEVAAAVTASAQEATRLLFGPTPVHFPLDVATVECYADAK
ncbi:bifunctional 3'-5' exonuclease/DNA polymerase [Actinocatenispora sera]|uniref:DNA-directed DNA polymerase n=1 Tax=Actinocatenispora sera TaxID=390989 RepID=A0A810LB39_9ACTN|nr:bifunctional 3'-5' exonuclease/DNA polymerase [Actinocatenispora sera]BCJ32473.1 DNA polymerase I [Actinocatenispora sera]